VSCHHSAADHDIKLMDSLIGNVQFDDPLLAYFCAESMIKGMEERGIDHEALLDLYIKTYNNCLKGESRVDQFFCYLITLV
jgi:hypothetical protein